MGWPNFDHAVPQPLASVPTDPVPRQAPARPLQPVPARPRRVPTRLPESKPFTSVAIPSPEALGLFVPLLIPEPEELGLRVK